MNPSYLELNAQILKVIKSPVDQGRIVAAAVAMAVSAKASLPSSPVASLAEYYGSQVLPAAMDTISGFGEGVVFATKTALENVQLFWKMRYYAAHPVCMMDRDMQFNIESMLNDTAVGGFNFSTLWSGGAKLVSTDQDAFFTKYKKEIMILAATVCVLLSAGEQQNG